MSINIGGKVTTLAQLREEERAHVEEFANFTVAPDDFNIYGVMMTRGYVETARVTTQLYFPKFKTTDPYEVLQKLEEFFYKWALTDIYYSLEEAVTKKFLCKTGNPVDLLNSIAHNWMTEVYNMGEATSDSSGSYIWENDLFTTDPTLALGIPAKNWMIFSEEAEHFMLGALNLFEKDPFASKYWPEVKQEYTQHIFTEMLNWRVNRKYDVVMAPLMVEYQSPLMGI